LFFLERFLFLFSFSEGPNDGEVHVNSVPLGDGCVNHGPYDRNHNEMVMFNMAIGIAILSQELDFQSLDQRPVRVIMMIVVNDQRTDLSLKALAAVSRMANHTSLPKRLKRVSDSNEVLSIIQEIEGQIAHH